MTDTDPKELVESWMAYWQHQWAAERLDDMCRQDPERALDIILAILAQDIPDETYSVLAAGPLEDLLVYNGRRVIDRVEARARSDARFRRLLGGVWQNRIEEAVWNRVVKARDEVW